jgi:hypothetical protein
MRISRWRFSVNKNLWVVAAVGGLALMGCDKKVEEAAKPAAAASAAASAATAVASAAASAAASVPASAEAAASAAGSAMAAAPGSGDPAAALGEALKAAAAAGGGTPCEQAFNGIEAMVKAMEAKMGPGKSKPLPPKEKFLAACAELPANVQNCMSMSYAMAHQQECQEAQTKLDPAVKEKFKALMTGN